MAYASVAQNEHETAYDDQNAVQTSSPTLPDFSHRPLSLSFEEISGDVAVVDPTRDNGTSNSQTVGNILKSISSSSQSYEMVEDDDYEEQLATPRRLEFSDKPSEQRPELEPEEHTTTSDLLPVRTASVSRNLRLNHPVPDLQSMQGAYVKNVERLEESAERLSMTSSRDDEIHRIKSINRKSSAASSNGSRHDRPARQFSTSSFSNSIIGVNTAARTGGYSPAGYITSPTGSIRSGSWVQHGPMQRQTSRTSHLGVNAQAANMDGSPLDMPVGIPAGNSVNNIPGERYERPVTSDSNETDERHEDPFADFDGDHYSGRYSHDRQPLRQINLQHPPLARDSRAFREAQPGENMIYYPAPVPVMLNLPTRLSRMNFGEREKRRLQALSGVPEEMRKSAAWLSQENLANPDKRNLEALPPQLRASAFFDQPSVTSNVALKNGSAAQTLDSILDAAAHAPVSAFTDHPIAGHLGKEVYGVEKSSRKSVQLNKEIKKKRRSSLGSMLKSRKSNGDLTETSHGRITSRESKVLDPEDGTSGDDLEKATARSIAPGEDEITENPLNAEDDSEAGDSDSEHAPGYSGAPTTLLAELQMRKAAQKQRNRTAADAFPNGMHSTLLELDAVTQLQQRSRKQKHVTLAWEDHEAADRENFDDEDVPLGVLFPEKDKPNPANANRPIGLIEKREMEENEPLSHRRARLRGEPVQIPRAQSIMSGQANNEEDDPAKYKIDLPGMSKAELDEPEGETLAQRMKRMKEEKHKVGAGNFVSDISSQLGLTIGDKPIETDKVPDAEETLGERRKRLKEEASKAGRPQLQGRRSMADLLQAHPVGMGQVSNQSLQHRPGALPRFNTFGPHNSSTSQLPAGSALPHLPAHMASLPYYSRASYVNPAGSGPANVFNVGAFGVNGQYAFNGGMHQIVDPMMGPPLDPHQRAVIDRWRQGVPGA